MFFKCKHPAKYLHVAKDSTVTDSMAYPGEFTIIIHHLYCLKCNERINIDYAKPNHAVIDANIANERSGT